MSNSEQKEDWLARDALLVGQKNVINEPLVNRDRIIFTPLHIKLGLIKQFVKVLDKKGACFKYIGKDVFCSYAPTN